ncbi:hypothetical protein [Serinicoccus sp. CUA-874]|uniref:hypothetical protein n=1 Tax=Serinicoccus sp. CUA-874 TaxID=1517939 RepID=UPI00096A30E8|nr:hypothetical protein [Serinicoccus sp. CUA-874]
MAAAYTGSTLAPPLFGLLSTWVGTWTLPLFLLALVALGLLMSERLNRLMAHRARADRLAALVARGDHPPERRVLTSAGPGTSDG